MGWWIFAEKQNDKSMVHRFATNKGPLFRVLFLGLPTFLALLTIFMIYQSILAFDGDGRNLVLVIVISSIPIFLSIYLLSVWYYSYYEVSEKFLYIRFGFASKKIAFTRIKSIKASTYPSAGVRYALTWNGLLIISKEGYQWFISPEDQAQFLEKIKF